MKWLGWYQNPQNLVSKNIACKIAKIFFGKSFSVIRCWHGRNELRIVSIAVDRRPHNMLSIHPCSKPVRDPWFRGENLRLKSWWFQPPTYKTYCNYSCKIWCGLQLELFSTTWILNFLRSFLLGWLLQVSKSQKQIFLLSIVPINEWKSSILVYHRIVFSQAEQFHALD